MRRRITIFDAELLLLLANPNRLNSATLRIVYDTSIIFFLRILLLKHCEQNCAQKNSYINSNKSGFCAEKSEAANDMKASELGI